MLTIANELASVGRTPAAHDPGVKTIALNLIRMLPRALAPQGPQLRLVFVPDPGAVRLAADMTRRIGAMRRGVRRDEATKSSITNSAIGRRSATFG